MIRIVFRVGDNAPTKLYVSVCEARDGINKRHSVYRKVGIGHSMSPGVARCICQGELEFIIAVHSPQFVMLRGAALRVLGFQL